MIKPGKSKYRIPDRILAFFLAFLMALNLFTFSADAQTESHPDIFTFTVTDGSNPLINVAVQYSVLVDDEEQIKDTVYTGQDGVAEIDLSAYEDDITADKTVMLKYTASLDGYEDKVDTLIIADVKANETLIMSEAASTAEKIIVSVTNGGNGIVKIDNQEVSSSVEVEKAKDFVLKIIPSDNYQIASIVIGGEQKTISDKSQYTETCNFSDDVNISVVFEDIKYKVTVNMDSNSGTAVVGDNNVTADDYEFEYVAGTTTAFAVNAKDGYRIQAVAVNGVNETVTDVYSFSKNLEVTQNISVTVTFVKEFKVTVVYDSELGTVTTTPAGSGNVVTTIDGTTVTIKASPKEKYRVAGIVAKDSSEVEVKKEEYSADDYNYNDGADNSKTVELAQISDNLTVEVTFVQTVFTIGVNTPDKGTVSPSATSVNYGQSITVTMIPAAGCIIDNVKVNGVEVNSIRDVIISNEDGSYTYVIDNITENTQIEVTYKEAGAVAFDDCLEFGNVLREYASDTEKVYVFKNAKISVKNPYSKVRVEYTDDTVETQAELNINSGKTIRSIEVNDGWKWNPVSMEGIRIAYDNQAPTITVNMPQPVNGYYNSDFNFGIAILDPTGDYSGIKRISYKIVKDDDENAQSIVLYEYTGDGEIKNSYADDNIAVSAVNYNSDDVKIIVTVEDRAGLTNTETKEIMINCTKPAINVDMGSDSPKKEYQGIGYYAGNRTATITITDRDTTFEAGNVNISVKKDGQDLSNENVIAMLSNWDTVENEGKQATLAFTEDGNYEWSISYTNKAGLEADNENITSSGNTPYRFVVDRKAPTASVTIDGSTWDSIVEILTFGIISREEIEVNVTVKDDVSPYEVLYYKHYGNVALSMEELNSLYAEGAFSNEVIDKISPDDKTVVYIRVTDYANNYTYVSSDGVIVEGSGSNITITPVSQPNENGYYTTDFDVTIDANDNINNAYSGVASVYYKVIKNNDFVNPTQSGFLYQGSGERLASVSDKITIDSRLNNSDKVVLYVTVVDNAGNESNSNKEFKINATAPGVTVEFDNNTPNKTVGGREYYGVNRTATITINDRNTTFDPSGVKITIAAKNADGDDVNYSANLSGWTNGETLNIHKAVITFESDANYEFKVEYTNKAGLTGSTDNYEFTVDKTIPSVGSIAIGDNNLWTSLLSTLTFGAFSKESLDVTVDGSDVTSPVIIEYFKSDRIQQYSKTELDEIAFSEFTELTINPDELCVIYAKITDYAGNYIYVSSQGIIVETNESIITISPEDYSDDKIYGLNYRHEVNKEFLNSVKVDIQVLETAEVNSGIRNVEYWVECNGTKTQEGTLFDFDIDNPEYTQLKQQFLTSIYVETEKNNSSDVEIFVKTVDMAGNEKTESKRIDIDVTAPSIKIEYDNNNSSNVDDEGNTYFIDKRVATITVTERNNHFNKDDVIFEIAAKDVNGTDIPADAYVIKFVEDSINVQNPDATKHIFKIEYNADGNYEFSVGYVDKAGNSNTTIDTIGQVAPYKFTIDTTAPASGSIKIESNVWESLLETLTFGIWKNEAVNVEIFGSDATSKVRYEYYKTDNLEALDYDDLEQIEFTAFESLTINPDERFVVYAKIIDYAGNYIYICSDGHIIDNSPSDIEIIPEPANSNGLYGLDYKNGINVTIKVTESEPCSGIKSVDYWVENNGIKTQEGNMYTFDGNTDIKYENLKKQFEDTVIVYPELNNSCNVTLYIHTVDNAGNENTESADMDIDVTAPTIKMEYDNNSPSNIDSNGNTYFTGERTAIITITERQHHFDKDKAVIKVTAKDSKGVAVTGSSYSVKFVEDNINDTNPDASTHIYEVKYLADANYELEVSYVDDADNSNESIITTGQVAPYKFTIDRGAPFGSITAIADGNREKIWDSSCDKSVNLIFGFWAKQTINITNKVDDLISPIDTVEYWLSESKKSLSSNELDNVTDWKTFSEFIKNSDGQFTIYMKIVDCAGNYSYVRTDGLIIDSSHPDFETVAPEITIVPEQPINGIYGGDVKVKIVVEDPVAGNTFSGLNEIKYEVYNRDSAAPDVATQSGILYKFDSSVPERDDLKRDFAGEITVDSTLNNSNNIQIVVYASDNAGNAIDNISTDSVGYTSIKIDTTKPVINISYDNNNADSGMYFKENRIATIVISERNFDEKDVEINITTKGGTIPAVVGWKHADGALNNDDATHTATIEYSDDGDYEFEIAYKDMAGNVCEQIIFAPETVAGSSFTIDKTVPVITVLYDNNDVRNGNYYKATRTATIVINEHNFSTDRVVITMTASDDGIEKDVPTVSQWISTGDDNMATIVYEDDALYTFDITCRDMAGNVAEDFANQTFYVDKTAPSLKITGVQDKSANNGDVAPIITYSDTNFDDNQVSITLTGANRKSVQLLGNYSEIHNGKIFTFENFAKEKQIDDIYTLNATLTDKAGNTSTETINFSVNRFGSTYAMSDSTEKLNGTYMKEPQDVVLVETNANALSNVKITVFKNSDTVILQEGKDYRIDIKGGEGQWHEYTYTIFKENFEDDGVYRLTVHSEDAAGNIAENTLDTKEKEVNFGIDKTLPTLNIKNIESNKTYAVDNITVQMSANDNLKFVQVMAYLDGREYKKWTGEELEAIITSGNDFELQISGESTSAHNLEVIVTDAAGNQYAETISNFYVTTNVLVRYYNNKALFYGSIIGTVVVAGLIIGLVVYKRRKRNE